MVDDSSTTNAGSCLAARLPAARASLIISNKGDLFMLRLSSTPVVDRRGDGGVVEDALRVESDASPQGRPHVGHAVDGDQLLRHCCLEWRKAVDLVLRGSRSHTPLGGHRGKPAVVSPGGASVANARLAAWRSASSRAASRAVRSSSKYAARSERSTSRWSRSRPQPTRARHRRAPRTAHAPCGHASLAQLSPSPDRGFRS